MPDPASARKPRHRWLIAPYLLVAVLAIAWSVAWFYGRGRIEAALDSAAALDAAVASDAAA